MAEEMQGIMSLMESQQPDQNQGDLASLYDPVIGEYAKNEPRNFSRDILGGMAEVEPAVVDRFIRQLAAMDLPPEIIDALQLMVDTILSDPSTYAEDRKDLIEGEVPEELLPEQFDPSFFAALNLALDQLEINKPQVPQFAQGGIINAKTIAQELAKMGRGGDTMLAHITPSEARMLRRKGGSGTINPVTGLPEFFLKKAFKAVAKVFKGAAKAIKSVAKSIGNVVKDIAGSTIGKIALTFAAVYFMGPAGLNLAGGTGSITGITNAVAANVVNTIAGSTLVNVASGQKLGDALKGGIVSGALAGATTAVFGGGVPGAPREGGLAPVIDKSSNLASTAGTTLDDAALIGVPTPSSIGPGSVTASTPLPGAGAAQTFPLTSPPPVVGTSIGAKASGLVDDFTPSFTQNNVPAPVPGAAPVPAPSLTRIPDIASTGIAKSAAATAQNIPTPTTSPGFFDSLKQGNLSDAASAVWKNISPSEIQQAGIQDALATVKQQFPGVTDDMITSAAAGTPLAVAYKAALPGVLKTYGPAVGLGLGAAALMGGFDEPKQQLPDNMSEFETTGSELLAQQPGTYGLNFGGTRTVAASNPYERLYSAYQTTTPPPVGLAKGGIASLPDNFPRKTGPISGPGTGTSDSVPAMLSDGEFVFTAKAVRAMGNGSRRKGAKRMYALMKQLEKKG